MALPAIKFNIHADIKNLRKTAEAYKEEHWQSMKRLWRDGARAFINELISGKVHVLTGMSAASIIPLAQLADYRSAVEAYMLTNKGARKGMTEMSGNYNKDRWQSIAEGIRAGSRSSKLTFGSPARPYMQFNFDIMVYQWAHHEDNWGAIDAGISAWRAFIKTNFNSGRYRTSKIKLRSAIMPNFVKSESGRLG